MRLPAVLTLIACIGCAATKRLSDVPSAREQAPRTATVTRELSPAEQVAHVLSRLTFGARPGDADRVAAIGVDSWIEEQLHPGAISDRVVSNALSSMPAWTRPTSNLGSMAPPLAPNVMVNPSDMEPLVPVFARRDSGNMRLMSIPASMKQVPVQRPMRITAFAPIDQLAAGKIIHAQVGERQVFEVIADFWENHFSVYVGKMPTTEGLIVWDRDVIRPHALGKFRDLLGATAHSPAMLFYLDNQLSMRGGINENYARELLELHTLGVDGGYTQQDVIAVARALTGWTLALPRSTRDTTTQNRFEFRQELHDTSAKVFLGHTLAAGRGIEDGEEVLDILARHPSTAHFIAYKLARRLVSDVPPASVVDSAAATFMRTDGDITEVVRTIVTSSEFFSRAAFRAKAKTPFEFAVAVRRALNAPPDASAGTARLVRELGQPTFGRATPDGWPDDAGSWINAGSILGRVMLTKAIATGDAPFSPLENWDRWVSLQRASAAVQADGVVKGLLGGFASPATLAVLLTTPGDSETRLRGMIAVAIGSPEFQRR